MRGPRPAVGFDLDVVQVIAEVCRLAKFAPEVEWRKAMLSVSMRMIEVAAEANCNG